MFRFLRRLRRRPQPEPLLRAATIYPNRSGAYGPHVPVQGPRNMDPTIPTSRKGPRRG